MIDEQLATTEGVLAYLTGVRNTEGAVPGVRGTAAKIAECVRLAYFVEAELRICERQVEQGSPGVRAAVGILKLVKHRATVERLAPGARFPGVE